MGKTTKISVIGMGYVGVVTAVGLAEQGNNVIGMDIDKNKINSLRNLDLSFSEPNLKTKLKNDQINKNLIFTSDLESAISESEIIFICVGTPPKEDRSQNLSYINDLSTNLSTFLINKDTGFVIVNRSTCLPGTGNDRIIPILEKGSGLKENKDFYFCSNPEFMREGSMLDDFLYPELIVVGGNNNNAMQKVINAYGSIAKTAREVFKVDVKTAEMTKYAFNCNLVAKISFANEIAMISDELGIDGRNVMEIVKADKRIMVSSSYLSPGFSYGGSCLPKDPPAIVHHSIINGYQPKFFESMINLNNIVFDKAIITIEGFFDNLSDKIISVFGVSFKMHTSDIRESKTIELIKLLLGKGAIIRIVDPLAINEAKVILGNKVVYSESISDAIEGSDLCILGLNYDYFNSILHSIESMKTKIIFDLCDHNIQKVLKEKNLEGLIYKGIHW